MNLPVDYHQQDERDYCGAACAQMVLKSIGAHLLSQDPLFDDCHANSKLDRANATWHTAPDGLKWTLNHRKPRSFRKRFKIVTQTDPDAIFREIAWSLYHDNVAVMALVYGGGHWVIVRGFDATSAPAGPNDESYDISAFWINNPSPFCSPPFPPPPHGRNDLCGSDGRTHGKANQNIPYDNWKGQFLTAVSIGRYWNGKFVAVYDPDPESRDENTKEKEKEGSAKRSQSHSKKTRKKAGVIKGSKKIINEQQAQIYALKAIEDYGLADQPFLKDILKDILPAKPKLVRHLAYKNDFYYIVPLVGKDKKIRSLISVNRKGGQYKQGSFAKDLKHPIVFDLFNKRKIINLVAKELGIKKGTIMVNAKYLVWIPCIESFSPDLPFHEVAIGSDKAYLRIDGKVFTKLTIGTPA